MIKTKKDGTQHSDRWPDVLELLVLLFRRSQNFDCPKCGLIMKTLRYYCKNRLNWGPLLAVYQLTNIAVEKEHVLASDAQDKWQSLPIPTLKRWTGPCTV